MIVDAAIVAVIGFFVWRGVRRGLLAALLGFAGFLAAVAAAVFGYRLIAIPLEAVLRVSPGVANLAGALVLFLGVATGALFLGRAITRAMRGTKWGALNAIAGGALSGTWALALVTVVLLSLSVIPLSAGMERTLDRSAIASAIVDEAPGWLDAIARTDLRDLLRVFTPEHQPVAIRATPDFQRAEPLEGRLFALLNAERRARGLPVLSWDGDLARAARSHAADMYANGFFSHDSPSRGSTADRLRGAGARFARAGENLVLAPTLSSAHATLMSSRRHRGHILSRAYARVGIGVMYGRQGLLVTQNFAG